MGNDITIINNNLSCHLRRQFKNSFELNITFDNVYVDYDDTMVINDKWNYQLIGKLFEYKNIGKKIILITRNEKPKRIKELFDKVIIVKKCEPKSKYITSRSSIFIDDSHKERLEVHNALGIPVFDVSIVGDI
jgi:hypothetical protein